jgi:hypothetical protein
VSESIAYSVWKDPDDNVRHMVMQYHSAMVTFKFTDPKDMDILYNYLPDIVDDAIKEVLIEERVQEETADLDTDLSLLLGLDGDTEV